MAGIIDEVKKLPVAFLDVYHSTSAEEGFQLTRTILPIYPNEDFFFGRANDCKYQCGDIAVSNKHLHVRCIIFEEGSSGDGIPPLVYVEDLSTNGTYLTRSTSNQLATKEQRMSRRDGKILLGSNDQLRVSPTLALRFRYSATIVPNSHRLRSEQQREAELFADRYKITNRILGSGGQGQVFVAIHKKSSRQLACKIVDMLFYKQHEMKPLQGVTNRRNGSPINCQKGQSHRDDVLDSAQFRECDILKDLDHPNIIRLEKVFWSSNTIFMLQEMITGGDLFSYIEYQGGKLSDTDSAVILLQLLKGIEYMHDRDIVHRDLKPDNILVSINIDSPLRIIITDFGSCRRIETAKTNMNMAKQRMYTIVGTLEYAAPEIYDKNNNRLPGKKGYSKAVDMWSIGAVATALLTGDVIFTDRLNPMMQKDPAKVILEISSKCDLSILDNGYSAWRAVGKRPKEFVRSLLVVDESKRLDVKQALAHDWFTNKHCDGAFNAVYQKAVKDWQPRRKHVRVVEALDLGRLPPGSSEMYPKNIPSLTKAGPSVLPTIGEEDTSEPSTPDQLTPDAPMAPKAKKPSRAATAFDVQYSLIQLDIDTAVTPSEASADIAMTDREQPDEYDSYDIDAPVVPINIVQNPSQDLFAAEVIRETPPSMRKRPRESDSQMDDDTYDSSLEIVGKRFDRPVSANMWKKTRLS